MRGSTPLRGSTSRLCNIMHKEVGHVVSSYVYFLVTIKAWSETITEFLPIKNMQGLERQTVLLTGLTPTFITQIREGVTSMKPIDPGANREWAVELSGLQNYAVIKKKAGIARLGLLYFVKKEW